MALRGISCVCCRSSDIAQSWQRWRPLENQGAGGAAWNFAEGNIAKGKALKCMQQAGVGVRGMPQRAVCCIVCAVHHAPSAIYLMLCSVHCVLCSVCHIYLVLCTVYSVLCILCSSPCVVCCILCAVQRVLCAEHRVLCAECCALHALLCAANAVRCRLQPPERARIPSTASSAALLHFFMYSYQHGLSP